MFPTQQINTERRSLARFKIFSGLVGADRWRVSEWRLAAQQQRYEAQPQSGRTFENDAAGRTH